VPTFSTPHPLDLQVTIVGDLRVTASDRDDTVVTVTPRDPNRAADVAAARDTVVEHAGDTLVVRTPKRWTRFTPFGGGEAVHVSVEAPSGSRLEATTDLGDLHLEGELGACQLKTAMGDIRVDHTGDLRAKTAHGDVAVDDVVGDAHLTTSSGDVVVRSITAAATVRNSNGATEIGHVGGDLQVKAANGDIVVGSAASSTSLKTANGDVRVGEVRSGAVVVMSSAGDLEVGVLDGVAAWLDLQSRYGDVRNELDDVSAPAVGQGTVEVRASTAAGDIVVRRVEASGSAAGELPAG
jgi:hypothetical protein